MNVQQLRDAVPALRPVPRPAHLAGGLVGRWSGPVVDVSGIALTPTFFFADAQLRRVEYLVTANPDSDTFDSLLRWGRAAWGPELASQNPEGAYATWAASEMDVYLQRTGGPVDTQVRLVIKRRFVKDASEL